jgi:hypothetical protein
MYEVSVTEGHIDSGGIDDEVIARSPLSPEAQKSLSALVDVPAEATEIVPGWNK